MASSRDELLKELLRFQRAPKVTFEKGLMETKNDFPLGYVSHLHNMDIEDGTAFRRRGTRCLNNPDDAIDMALIYSSRISGCDVCFVITKTRKLYAFVSNFPERAMPVFKRGFVPLRNRIAWDNDKEANDPTEKWRVEFDRGIRFHALESDDRLRFLNEFGDTFTINKNGYIQFFSDIKEITAVDLYTDIDAARIAGTSTVYLAVEVEDTTHRLPPDFEVIPDPEKKNIPLKGDVKIGIVNNEGVVGPLSRVPATLVDFQHCFISLVRASSLKGKFDSLGIAWTPEIGFTGSYLIRDAEFNSSATSDGTHLVIENGYKLVNSFPKQSNDSGVYEEVEVIFAQLSDEKWYMWFDSLALGLDATDVPSFSPDGNQATSPMVCSDLMMLGDIDDLALSSDEFDPDMWSAVPNMMGVNIPVLINIVGVRYHATVPLTYTWTGATHTLTPKTSYSGNVYLVDFSPVIKPHLTITPTGFMQIEDGLGAPIVGGSKNAFNLFKAKIKMLRDPSTDKLTFVRTAFKFNLPSGAGVGLTNKGYDCWEHTALPDVKSALSILKIDKGNLQLTLDTPYDLFSSDDDYWRWLHYGNRFAVYNDKKIVAVSQMCYIDRNGIGNPIIYDTITPSGGS